MTNLLKADFRRVLKDKLLLVMGILAVVFAVITPLLYVLIFSGSGLADDPMISAMVSAKTQFFGAFSIGNNMGLIAPVLLTIVLCKDFSFGTVRNKVIAGKSRTSIFMSLFVVCFVVLLAVMLIHAFITLAVCLLFFDYQPTAFTVSDFWYFLESLSFAILTILFVAALLSSLCASMKNVGLAIVSYVAISFGLTMFASILQMVLPFLETMEGNELLVKILNILNRVNVGGSISYIGTGTEYTVEDVMYLVFSPLVGTALLATLGAFRFNKRDLK